MFLSSSRRKSRHPVRPNTAKPSSNSAFSNHPNKFTSSSKQSSSSLSYPPKSLPQSTVVHNISYVSKTSNRQPSPAPSNPAAIISQLTFLVANLSSGTISIQEVVVAILNILIFLLTIHDQYTYLILKLSERHSETPWILHFVQEHNIDILLLNESHLFNSRRFIRFTNFRIKAPSARPHLEYCT